MGDLRAGLLGVGMMGRHHARVLSDLEEVDLVLGDTGLLQHFRDRKGRTDAHDFWRDTNDCRSDKFAQDRKAKFLCCTSSS